MDTISDFITRIRNANTKLKDRVDVPSSGLKVEIARILKDEGFIADVAEEQAGATRVLRLTLKY
ncbi:MAG TPA: 30S ribosomal protein S8, partial [Elusimicrobiota bacterium]|nr:30S ribosomal protein S8 [Elusimicrobiota bacterium]